MNIWPHDFGSPFNQGLCKNLSLYWCGNGENEKNYIEWTIPKRLPDEKIKGGCFIRTRLFFKWICE